MQSIVGVNYHETYQDNGVEKVAHNVIEDPTVGKRSVAAVVAEDEYRPHHCPLQEPVGGINGKILKYPRESQRTLCQ